MTFPVNSEKLRNTF